MDFWLHYKYPMQKRIVKYKELFLTQEESVGETDHHSNNLPGGEHKWEVALILSSVW